MPIDPDQQRWMNQCQRGMPWGRGHRDCGDWCPPRTQRYDRGFCRKPDLCRIGGGCHLVMQAEKAEEAKRHAPGPAVAERQAEASRREPTLGRRRAD